MNCSLVAGARLPLGELLPYSVVFNSMVLTNPKGLRTGKYLLVEAYTGRTTETREIPIDEIVFVRDRVAHNGHEYFPNAKCYIYMEDDSRIFVTNSIEELNRELNWPMRRVEKL